VQESRQVAVAKYFTVTPSKPAYLLSIIASVLGGISLLIVLYFGALESGFKREDLGSGCFGCIGMAFLLICIGLGAIGFINYLLVKASYNRRFALAEPKPSDEQIDLWHQADLEQLKKVALAKLDLVPEQIVRNNPNGPLVIEGAGPSPKVKIGKDGRVRFSKHEIMIMFLTDYHLAWYKCVIELDYGMVTEDTTGEYHYNDVVAVTTQTVNAALRIWLEGEWRTAPSFQKFSLSVSSGQETGIAISFHAEDSKRNVGRFNESGADLAIRNIRARLREKKGGTQERSEAGPELL
jgi:hypothetical protein